MIFEFYKGAKINPKMEFLKLGKYDWKDIFVKKEIKNQ